MSTVLTIGTLTRLDRLELTVLVAGPPGALDTKITWLHNTELPDPSGYIRPGELVLTNGLWYQGPDSARAFVQACQDADASGIVFGLRTPTPTTPPDLEAACREAGMPLLQLSIAVPFTAMTAAAADILAVDRQTPLTASLRRGTAFAHTLASGAGAAGVLRLLRHDHDLPLAVVDRAARVLAEDGTHLDESARSAAAVALTRHPPPLEVPLSPGTTATFLPIGPIGRPAAALLCLGPLTDLSDTAQQALEQAAHYLSMETARREAVAATEERFTSELLDLIAGGTGTAGEVTRRLRGFGLDPRQPLAVVATSLVPGQEAPHTALTDTLRAELAEQGVPAILATTSAQTVAVCTWRQDPRALSRWAGSVLEHCLTPRFPHHLPVIGYAGPATTPAHLRTPLLEARRACQVLARTATAPRAARLDDLPTYNVLLSHTDHQTLRQLADTVLGALRDNDTRHGTELEETLRVYLAHQGSPSGTVEALHLHVNSLYKRLRRIHELTGRDPATLTGRLDLFLALEADDLTNL